MAATRWAIVSSGKISTDFVQALKLLPAAEHQIVAVATRSLKTAQEFAEKFNIAKAYGSYQELANESNYDVVYIGSIHPMHYPLLKLFVGAGRSVLCEKTFTMNARELREIVHLAREKGVFLMEAFWSRFFPIYEDLRNELRRGNIGEVRNVTANFGGNFIKDVARVREKEFGGGVLLDMGCYPIQFAQLVYNHEQPQKISASGILDPKSGVDISVTVRLEYSNNRVAVLNTSGICTLDQRAVVSGDKVDKTQNTITLEDFWCPVTMVTPSKVYNRPLPESSAKYNFTNSQGLLYEAQSVRNCLLQGLKENPLMTLDMSLQIQDILDTVRRQLGIVYDEDQKSRVL